MKLPTTLVVLCRVKKSGPFWTRFSFQRVFFSHFLVPGEFFSHEVRGTEIGQREEKTLPKYRKLESKIRITFQNEVQKTFYLKVVYKREVSTGFSF